MQNRSDCLAPDQTVRTAYAGNMSVFRLGGGSWQSCHILPAFETQARPGRVILLVVALRHPFCCEIGVYLEYYGLTEPPFDITPNPRFLFYSAKHREAFNHLLYGIRERKGFVQMTGEVGAGKTTLCRAMLEQLDDHYATALILNPIMSAGELVKAIARSSVCR